ncbi:Conidial development protein fluffy [Fusarium austroafricanum]|uniref:Conidial development protein fluffy n=1 Tax=Fusarium austroafricanum TaxID=2364996 RepID=A0A8H4KXP4_9HYPO|nr:Conidial development protein fluffy [Fusarium austroafricanum]
MSNPNKPTRAQEHQKSNRQLLPRKASKTDHEPQYSPLDVSDIPRAALTSVACNNCRVRKSKCDGRKPTCSACASRRQQCIYRAEVSQEKMLELRQGSKDLFQALELLRTAPEDYAATMLQNLRNSGSVSEFLQFLNSGIPKTPSPVNPLTTTLVGTSANSRIELDLNMRYSSAFPPLEKLDMNDIDIALLSVHKGHAAFSNQQSTAPLTPYTPIEFQSRRSETPSTSESYSTPSDASGDAGIDPRLDSIQLWQWTSVPITETLAAQAISFYLKNEHPVLALFDADLFIRDFVAGGGRFCSPLLVSSLLAWSCASYSQFEPRAQTHSLAFLKEAKMRWRELKDRNSVTTLSSAMLLVLTCNQHGQDRVGLVYLDASAEIGRCLGLFGGEDAPMPGLDNDDELRTAASFAAWGAFGWNSLHSINFRAHHRMSRPPSLPIPGDVSGPPLNHYMGSTFTWVSKFWIIIHQTFGGGYNNFSRLPMSNAHQMYQLLLDWAMSEMDLKRLHADFGSIWYQTAIIDIWRPFLEYHSSEHATRNAIPNATHEASVHQLKRLIYTYRKRFQSTNLTMFITPGLLTLINEVFRKPDTPDAKFWFIIAARGCLSIASWCNGLRGITEGLMTVGWQNGTFKRQGWTSNSMIEDIRATTRTLRQDVAYSSVYPINLESSSEDIQDIGMEALAGEFQRLSSQNEPRGKEVEMTNEQSVWKGDPRDLNLTLSEATEEETYT